MLDARSHHQLEDLREEIAKKHPISLFLGSGISRGWGLPLWDDLCAGILSRALQARDPDTFTRDKADALARLYIQLYADGPLAMMQYAGDVLGDDFAEVVRTVLYQHEADPFSGRSALETVSRTIARNVGVIGEVVTYNYDDLLERLLVDQRSVHVQAVTSGQDLGIVDRSMSGVIIYYVHGRAPSQLGNRPSESVVATEGQYHELRQRGLDWRNLVQFQVLTTTRALFLGLSLNDPNLRWLMKTSFRETGRRHYVVDVAESATEVRSRSRQVGGTDCGEAAAESLARLRRDARERAGIHLGVEFIWLRDWDELPDMIDLLSVS